MTSGDGCVLYVHDAKRRRGRAIDDKTERIVEETRMGTGIDPAEVVNSRAGDDSVEKVDWSPGSIRFHPYKKAETLASVY